MTNKPPLKRIPQMHSVWAVAKNTIKQVLRIRIAAAFILILLILLPVMGFAMTGDGTLKGRLQTFVSYGLSLTALLLSLLTIAVSIYSLTSDIDQKQIFTVLTKPIRRYQLLIGKFLGVIIIDFALLALFSALIYTIAVNMPDFAEYQDTEINQAQNEFYTARAGMLPKQIDVSQEVQKAYKKLKKGGRLQQLYPNYPQKKIIQKLTEQKKLSKRSAAVTGELVWEFNNIKNLDPNSSIFVRFKFNVSAGPPDSFVYSEWFIGDDRNYPWNGTVVRRKDIVSDFHEIEVPASFVAEDGYLAVRFRNVPLNNTVVIFPPEDGLEVLYKADSFGGNFYRGVLLIFFRLLFLAALGIFAASFLSFPVAVLLCMVVFFTATISGFCLESFDLLSEGFTSFYTYTLRPLIQLLPQFDKFNPAAFLVPARLISWTIIAKAAALMVCLKASLAMLIALLIFNYREIARITV